MFKFFILGGQTSLHSVRMLREVFKKVLIWSVILTSIITSYKTQKNINFLQIKLTGVYYLAKTYSLFGQDDKIITTNLNQRFLIAKNHTKKKYQVKYLLSSPHIIKTKTLVIAEILRNIIVALFWFLGSLFVFFGIFLYKGWKTLKVEHLRGAKIRTVKELTKDILKYNKKKFKNRKYTSKKAKKKKYDYKIANIPFPAYSESLHTLITGGSGTGKTVIISDLIAQIRERGDKAIIYDKMGTFVSKFYNKDIDIILNPLDQRSPSWTVFNEARDVIDFDNIASALIPESPNNVDPFFSTAARTIFAEVANALKESGDCTNKNLLDKLLKAKLDEAAKLVQGTPAQALIDEKNPRTSLSVMSMLSNHLKSMTHLKDEEDINKTANTENNNSVNNKKFSIRDWVSDDTQKNFLFISSRADQHETLKPLISTWLEIAINSLLSLKQNRERKIWIIIDELPSLHYLPSLHSGLAESRQFGGAFVLSMQLMAQLRTIYGTNKAESTSGLCRTRVILASPDEETASWCSKNLGRQEIKESKESISMGANDMRDGTSISKIEKSKGIVLSSEIMSLPNLQAYIKPAGDFAVALSKIKYTHRDDKAESFIRFKKNKEEDKKDEDGNKDNFLIENMNMYGVQMRGNYQGNKQEEKYSSINPQKLKEEEIIKIKFKEEISPVQKDLKQEELKISENIEENITNDYLSKI